MDVTILIKQNDRLQDIINTINNQAMDIKREIKENEQYIYMKCVHEWVYDRSCCQHDQTKYYCKHCMLWRRRDMYL